MVFRGWFSTLDLSENELTGSLPGELGYSGLMELKVTGNPLEGALPRDLMLLDLHVFHWDMTDLCAPTDEAFQKWLAHISDVAGRNCDSP